MHVAAALMATVLSLVPGFVEPFGSAPPLVGSTQFGMHAIAAPPQGLAGMGTVRLWDTDTTWRVLNPAPGVYRWDTLDARIQGAIDSGSTVLMVLGGTPEWAAASTSDRDASWIGPGSASRPQLMSDWWAFVHAVVMRYGGRIEAYQIWNEPWDPIFWRGSWDELAQMTQIAFNTIRSWDSNALIVSAPLSVRGPTWRSDALRYVDALHERGMPVDVMSFHGYMAGPPARSVARIRELQRLLGNSRAAGLPLWETEVNFINQHGGTVRPPNAIERTWLARAYLDAVRLGVSRVYWYAYGDVPDSFAIDIRKGRVSAAFTAVSHWAAGARFEDCSDAWQTASAVTACSFVDRDGLTGVALWTAGPQSLAVGRGTARDLEGRSWSVSSDLLVDESPVWFRPSPVPD